MTRGSSPFSWLHIGPTNGPAEPPRVGAAWDTSVPEQRTRKAERENPCPGTNEGARDVSGD